MVSRLFIELVMCAGVITSAVAASKSLPYLSTEGWFGPEFSVLQKVYDDCIEKNDFTGCLKGKALVALTKAVDQVRIFELKQHIYRLFGFRGDSFGF